MMSDVTITGMDEVLKKLKILPERVQKNVLTGAIRAGAKPIIKEARALVPKDTGTLKKSIGVVKRKSKDKNIVNFVVAPRSKMIWKEQAKETQPKFMVSKVTGRKYLNIENYAGHVEFGRGKSHASPFMRPAYEKEGDNTIKEAKSYMIKRIDKELAKL